MNETVEPLLQEPLWETAWKFIPRALLGGDVYETALALVLCGLGIFFVTLLLFHALEAVKRSLPWYAHQPPGWPSWKKFRVLTGTTGEVQEFVWRYPWLVCERVRYDFSEALQDSRDSRRYMLKTGTMMEFVRKKKPPAEEGGGAGAKAGKKNT